MRAGSKPFLIVILSLFAAGQAAPLRAARVRFELGVSGWTLDPFTTPIENETKKVIEQEILRFMKPILKYIPPPDIRQNLNLDSSGVCWSATVWIPLYSDRLEAGLKCSVVRLRVPFTLTVEQVYSIIGYDLVRVNGSAEGRVRFNTFLFGLVGRWNVLRTGPLRWSLTAGLTALPFKGDVAGSYELTATTPIGSLTASGSDKITIEELRKDHEDIPTVLVSPYVSVACQIRLARRISLVFEAAVSQGTFLSAGLSIGL